MLNLARSASQANSTRLKQKLVLASLVAAMLLVPTLRAQVLYGSLTGHVTDSTGAVLASAHVEAVNVNTGVVSQATTDASGGYRFTALQPGVYRVSISATGFKTITTDGVRVSANAVARVDSQMEVARTSETITVTAEAQMLQTDRSDVHSDLNATQIQSLPAISSEGKSFQGLYRIIPGASLPTDPKRLEGCTCSPGFPGSGSGKLTLTTGAVSVSP